MISTQAFNIEPLSLLDVKSFNKLMVSNAENFKDYLPKTLNQNLTLEASQKFVVSKVEKHISKDELLFVIKENQNNEVVGLVYIKELDWNKMQGEFAYCIDPRFEGKGWMSQTIKLLSYYALDELGLKTLQIIAHKSNLGSIKVAENCNFIWQKTLINEYTPPNKSPLDMELYELYK
jgi:ribosomal-protein-alanine N-acetyltransferase